MKNTAKKTIALLLTMLMLLGVAMPVVGAVETTSYPSYDEADEGDLLYTANFNGDEFYTPARMEGYYNVDVTADVTDEGRTVTLTGASSGNIFYGSTVNGLTLEDRVYTITYEVTRKSVSDVYAGFYVDAEHEKYGFNGFVGEDVDVVYRAGTGNETSFINYENLGISPLNLNTTDVGMITQKIKLIVDVAGDSFGYYILTDAADGTTPEKYAKVMEVRPSNTDRGYAVNKATGNLGIILFINNTSPVTFSNVNIYKGGAISVQPTGQELLSLDSMSDAKTGNNGVTYSPTIDQKASGTSYKINYSYKDEIHYMAVPSFADTTSDRMRAAYGGTTNLRVGNGEKYTISYYQKLHLAGGDVGLQYLTNHSSSYIAHGVCFQWGNGTGQPAIYKTGYNGSMSRNAGYNTSLGQLHQYDGYIFVQIEIDDTLVTVYTNGTQALSYDYGDDKEMYGLLSLSVFEYNGSSEEVHTSYKDIKVYSGNIVSERYVTVIDGETTETVDISASETTYTLPTRTAPAGYVFNGWKINGEGEPVAAGKSVSTDGLTSITAVYTKAMADVWVQFGNTNTEKNTTDMRIVGVLDSLNYQSIGYDVVIKYTVNGEPQEYVSEAYELHNVYNSLLAKYGTEVVTPETLGFGADSGYYLTAFTIFNIPTNIGEITFELTPYQIDLDGNKMPGETISLSFNQMWAKHTASEN